MSTGWEAVVQHVIPGCQSHPTSHPKFLQKKEKLLFPTKTKQEMYLLNLSEAASQYF